MRNPTAATVVWVATAKLHKERGVDATFTEEEIVSRATTLGKHDPETYRTHVHQRVLATNTSGEGTYAYLTRVGHGRPARYRLYRPGDPAYGRRKRHTTPSREVLPERDRPLLEWYEAQFAERGGQTILHLSVPPPVMLAIRNEAARTGRDEEMVAAQVLSGWATGRRDPFLELAGIGKGGPDDAERHDEILYG